MVRNSAYLMLGTFVMAAFGILFWTLTTRLYTAAQVGIASTLVAAMTTINTLSALGLGAGLIRYLPASRDRDGQINSSLVIAAIVAAALSLLFALSVGLFAPALSFLGRGPLLAPLFALCVALSSLNGLVEGVFIAARSTGWIVVKNLVISALKLALPLALLPFGAFGLFLAAAGAVVVGVALGIAVLRARFDYRPAPTVDPRLVKDVGLFSLGNYAVNALTMAPLIVLPLLITDAIGPRMTAYYAMAMTIASMLYVVPQAATQSLLAEGAHDEGRLREHVARAAGIIAAIVLPAVVLAVLFGYDALRFFGRAYAAEGYRLFQLLAVSAVFVSINYVRWTILNVRCKIMALIVINAAGVAATIALSVALVGRGLPMLGVAWLVGQALTSLLYAGHARLFPGT